MGGRSEARPSALRSSDRCARLPEKTPQMSRRVFAASGNGGLHMPRWICRKCGLSFSHAGKPDTCPSCGKIIFDQYNFKLAWNSKLLVMFTVLLIAAILGVPILVLHLDEQKEVREQCERDNQARADLIEKARQNHLAEEEAERRLAPIRQFVNSLVRHGTSKEGPEARFLKAGYIPCSRVTNNLGPPDEIVPKKDRTNTNSADMFLVYHVPHRDSVDFECLGSSNGGFLYAIFIDKQAITYAMWSGSRN